MGVFTRADSPYYWLWLETTRQKEKTDIAVGTTTAQKHDTKALAVERYHQRMNEIAARLYRLPSAQPAIRFEKYAVAYKADVIAHHKGAEREREMLDPLLAFFKHDLLTAIDQDRVRSYWSARKPRASARTINREVDLLKAMLRDAAPKYLTASPLVGMKRLKVVTPRRRLMTEREEAKILAHATPLERALVLLGVDGLLRMGDILDVGPGDRHGRWLRVADPKSGEPYEAYLTPRAAKALDALPKGGRYYFQRYRGAETDRDRRSRVRRVLKKLCRRAGVKYGKTAGGLTFHWATRKTGATRLVVTHKASIPAVQRQGNWKTPDVLLSIYAEADRHAQREAISLPHRSRSKRKSA